MTKKLKGNITIFLESKSQLLDHLAYTVTSPRPVLQRGLFDTFGKAIQPFLDDERLAHLKLRLQAYLARYMEVAARAGIGPQLSDSQPGAWPGPSVVPPASARDRHQPSLPQLHHQHHPPMPAARGPDAEESWEKYYADEVKGRKNAAQIKLLMKITKRWSGDKQDFDKFIKAKKDLQSHLLKVHPERMGGMNTDLIAAKFENFYRAFQRLLDDERLQDMKVWLKGYGARYMKVAILAGLGPQISALRPGALPGPSEAPPASASDRHPPSLPQICSPSPVPRADLEAAHALLALHTQPASAVRGLDAYRQPTMHPGNVSMSDDPSSRAHAQGANPPTLSSFNDVTRGIYEPRPALPSCNDLIKGMREYQNARGPTRERSLSADAPSSSRWPPPR